eukprot:GHUV01034500.1.p1 GENE.GHUV01034500.1~~GHUV01034500.1.p1  ORF type:complete len:109 (+),score=18.30 GHUV01034500.1:305-631(+)
MPKAYKPLRGCRLTAGRKGSQGPAHRSSTLGIIENSSLELPPTATFRAEASRQPGADIISRPLFPLVSPARTPYLTLGLMILNPKTKPEPKPSALLLPLLLALQLMPC